MAISLQTEAEFGVPRSFIDDVPDGYYAVRLVDDGEYTFLRVSRPTYGEYKDCVKFQTQHGDTLKIVCILRPDGIFEVRNGDIKRAVLLVVSQRTQAALAYGRAIGSCCRCGKTLTREPWIEYGIGIECDALMPEIRELAEELAESEV